MTFLRKLISLSVLAIVSLSSLLVIRMNAYQQMHFEEKLMLYCAAGVKTPVLKAVDAFEKQYGIQIEIQFGGSGTLLNNLQVSKQGDLYLAADFSYLEIAQEKGLVTDTIKLAEMKPVLTFVKGNPQGLKGIADLLKKDIRLSLGNPEAASIGKQTKLLFEAAGLWHDIKRQVERYGVFKPTVPEVANDVKLGAVDAGIVWDATVHQYDGLESIEIDVFNNAYKQISVGVLKTTQQSSLALQFAHFLKSEAGKAIFKSEGYKVLNLKVSQT